MQEIIFNVLSGVISGVIASVLLNYYWNKKPKLLISKHISKNVKNEYRIKIVNLSKFFVTNIDMQLQLVSLSNGNGGVILKVVNLDMPYKTIKMISPYCKKDENASYAVRFVLPNELENIWKKDETTYIKLLIYCSNEHNNSSHVFEQCYYKKNEVIIDGEFKFGKSLEIV